METEEKAEAQKIPVDDLLPGRSYRVEVDDDGVTRLTLLQRNETDLPRVPVLPDVLSGARTLQRSMKSKALGGWRPDIALVVSALVAHGLRQDKAKQIVTEYVKHHMENLEDD